MLASSVQIISKSIPLMMTFKGRRMFAQKKWRNVNDLIISPDSDDRLPMESCSHILKSKDYGDNDPVVRENAECVKKLFHIIQSHLTGDWAQYSMHFFSNKKAQSNRWSCNFTIPMIKVLSVWICFWKWPCQSLRSGDAAHFNGCFLPWLDWTLSFCCCGLLQNFNW